MTISQDQWDQQKSEIYRLYYELNHPIRDVIEIMKDKGFKASYVTNQWSNIFTNDL